MRIAAEFSDIIIVEVLGMELNVVRGLLDREKKLEQSLAALDMIASPTTHLDGMPKAKAITSHVEAIVQKRDELQRELEAIRVERENAALDLLLIIMQRVSGKQFEVLYRRYCMNAPFRQIAFELDLSDARIFQIHQEAVAKFNAADN